MSDSLFDGNIPRIVLWMKSVKIVCDSYLKYFLFVAVACVGIDTEFLQNKKSTEINQTAFDFRCLLP